MAIPSRIVTHVSPAYRMPTTDAMTPQKIVAPPTSGAIGRSPAEFQASQRRLPLTGALAWIFFCGTAAFCYAECVSKLAGRWRNDSDYSYGFLVPVVAVVLLWYRRDMLQGVRLRGSFWGLSLLAMSAAMRCASAYFYYELLDPASILPALAGLILFVGGWNALRWAGPSIVMLAFMIPLPGFVATLLALPLQRIATTASTYMIQTIGVPAVAEGNVISLGEAHIGVAEACNGLRNMMLFLAVCSAAAFFMKRSLVEKAIVVLSAAPIAIIANLVRITATAVLHSLAHPRLADTTYHTLAGWFMMPLAVALLWIELAMLRRIFIPAPPEGPIRI